MIQNYILSTSILPDTSSLQQSVDIFDSLTADDLRPVDEVHVPVSVMSADLVMVYVPNSVLGSMPVMADNHCVEHSVPLAVMAADLVMVYVPNSELSSMPVMADDCRVEVGTIPDDRRVVGPVVHISVPISVLGWSSKSCR